MNTEDVQEPGDADRIISEELQRLLESPMFGRSPVLSRLLRYLVDYRLHGGRSAPKAYAIATEALGRGPDFDPAVDSYPRVMVGRLRTLLDRYYSQTAWIHRLRIPQGSYEVVVQHRSAPPARSADDPQDAAAGAGASPPDGQLPHDAPAPSKRRRIAGWALSLAVFLIALFVGWKLLGGAGQFSLSKPVPLPSVEVSPPQSGDSAVSRAIARALDGKLRDGIHRFALVNLVSPLRPGSPSATADYRLDSSIVRTVAGPIEVTLILNRVADQRTIWSQRFRIAHDDIPALGDIEPAMAKVAGDFGVIVRDQVQRRPDDYAPGYPCLAQYSRWRQLRLRNEARKVESCLRATLVHDPADPVPLAALSLLRFSDWHQMRGSPAGAAAFSEARQLAQRAFQNSPDSSAGLFAMARANFFSGDCAAGAALGRIAARVNPYDPDVAGFFGVNLVACGEDAAAEIMLKRSLALDGSVPGMAAVTLALMHAERGEVAEARALLDQLPSPHTMEPMYLLARSIVNARDGDREGARRTWKQLVALTQQPADAPAEQVLRQFMVNPRVIRRVVEALHDAEVVTPARRAPRSGV